MTEPATLHGATKNFVERVVRQRPDVLQKVWMLCKSKTEIPRGELLALFGAVKTDVLLPLESMGFMFGEGPGTIYVHKIPPIEKLREIVRSLDDPETVVYKAPRGRKLKPRPHSIDLAKQAYEIVQNSPGGLRPGDLARAINLDTKNFYYVLYVGYVTGYKFYAQNGRIVTFDQYTQPKTELDVAKPEPARAKPRSTGPRVLVDTSWMHAD